MSTLLRRLAALEKQLGPPQDTSREDFSKTPEAVAWRLIAESERRLILDLFEGREDGYEPEAVTLQSATPEQAAAHARYQRFVHIHKRVGPCGRAVPEAKGRRIQRRLRPRSEKGSPHVSGSFPSEAALP